MSTLRANSIQNTSGVEQYLAKAWVNFNGTGTVAIRAAGNVSSITDNGVGDYTVNFTSALADANYAVIGLASETVTNNATRIGPTGATYTASACRIQVNNASSALDRDYVLVSFVR